MGAGNVKEAKNAGFVTLKLSCLLALTVLLSLAFGHDIWARSFTSNTMIVQEFASMTPFLSVSIFLDSAQGVLSGDCKYNVLVLLVYYYYCYYYYYFILFLMEIYKIYV